MVDIHRHADEGRPVHLKEIAERTELSRGYLEQLAAALRNAALLRGISGRKGGYLLAKEAGEIKVLDIIEAAIGPISVTDCATSPDTCSRTESCECNLVWRLLNREMRRTLSLFSLDEIAHESWRKRISSEIGELDDPPSARAGRKLWKCQQPERG